jgi:hypothetical protein
MIDTCRRKLVLCLVLRAATARSRAAQLTHLLPSLPSCANLSNVRLHLASSFSPGLTVDARDENVEVTRDSMEGASGSDILSTAAQTKAPLVKLRGQLVVVLQLL